MYSLEFTHKKGKLSDIRRALSKVSVFLIFALFTAGCASVNYVGDEFPSTTNIDIYYSEDAIDKDYDLIGHGLGSGFWVRNQKIQSKIIEEAKEKGADAILITGLGKSNVIITNALSADEKQMNVAFLRYR